MWSSMGWQAQGVGPAIDYASGSLAGPISGENRRLIPVANAAGLTQDRTPEGLAHPETCRPIYSRSTATAGVAARFTQQLLKPE
jgi:hypothetical protein